MTEDEKKEIREIWKRAEEACGHTEEEKELLAEFRGEAHRLLDENDTIIIVGGSEGSNQNRGGAIGSKKKLVVMLAAMMQNNPEFYELVTRAIVLHALQTGEIDEDDVQHPERLRPEILQ